MEGVGSKLLILLLYSIFIIAPSIYAKDFKYCNKKKDYAVKVSDVIITPDPIRKGKQTTFTFSAITGKPIPEGKVTIDVAYFGLVVYSETGDLCDSLSCPVLGDFAISRSQFLPTYAPPGMYTLTLKIQDGDKNELTCIKFDFKIGFFVSEGVADS